MESQAVARSGQRRIRLASAFAVLAVTAIVAVGLTFWAESVEAGSSSKELKQSAKPSQPSLTLSTSSGAVGSSLRVDGRGFARRTTGQLFFNNSPASVPQIRTDNRGSFSATLSVPNLAGGTYPVTAAIGGEVVVAPYTITSNAVVAVVTPTPTSTPTVTPTPTLTTTPTPTAQVTACSTTIQALVNAAAPGSTVNVPPCIYRETVSIDKPLILAGRSGVEIRGSDVWTNWLRNGSYWVAGPVPALPVNQDTSRCRPNTSNRCIRPEQVFINDRPLTQVSSSPAQGQFALDSSRNILLADDPTGKTVEVTVRQKWVVTRADNVTIQGFTMKHAGNDAQTGAIASGGRSSWTLQNNVLSDAHGAVVAANRGMNVKILNNDIGRGGQLGLHGGDAPPNLLIQGNKIHDNNTEDFQPGWEAGATKITVTTGTIVDSNEVYNNDGAGLWCDERCTNVVISNNRVHDNSENGIHFEISNGARIYGNEVWGNGWARTGWGWGAGILISSSANAEVFNNVVAWNEDGISVISQNRTQYPHTGNYVHDNQVMQSKTNTVALGWYQDWAGVLYNSGSNNRGANNSYWFSTTENGYQRYEWQTPKAYLADFNSTPGEEGGRYLSNTELDQTLASAGIPSTVLARQ